MLWFRDYWVMQATNHSGHVKISISSEIVTDKLKPSFLSFKTILYN